MNPWDPDDDNDGIPDVDDPDANGGHRLSWTIAISAFVILAGFSC